VHAEELRIWTDHTGQHARDAVFEKLDGGFVHLRSKEGKSLKIRIEKLSESDQAYARTAALKASDPFEESESPPVTTESMLRAVGDGATDADFTSSGASPEDPSVAKKIEEVLRQDVGLVTAARSTSEVASLMKDIDLSGCPPEFRKAYVDHIHAWENAVVIEGKIQDFNDDAYSAGALLEGIVRGYMGDVAGPVLETMQGTKQLKSEAAEAQQGVHASYQVVEAIAVRQGADIRRVNALRRFLAENSAIVMRAASGDPKAMALLGHAYASANNPLVKNDAEAIRWCQKAAEANDAFGIASVGYCYEKGIGVAQDEAEALRWHRKAAKAGDGFGMFSLSQMYADGRGVARDDAEAVRWCRKAAEAGHGFSMTLLATRYASGIGVVKDDGEALRWYRNAAEAGDLNGMIGLASAYVNGMGVARNESEALQWFRKAAEAGNVEGMSKVAAMYQSGSGVAKDEAEAAKWHRKAGQAGSPDSLFMLGTMYEFGQGVAKDASEAAGLYREASELGHAAAMFFLGMLYQEGSGVAKNEAEAVQWYRRSAEAGHPAAMTQLAKMLLSGTGAEKNDTEAVNWLRKGAEAGDGVAMTLYAMRCEQGDGVGKNVDEAVQWYRRVLETPSANDMCRQFATQQLSVLAAGTSQPTAK